MIFFNKQLKAGWRKDPDSKVGHWQGVIKNSKNEIVWCCHCLHQNRQVDNFRFGIRVKTSAFTCSQEKLDSFKQTGIL